MKLEQLQDSAYVIESVCEKIGEAAYDLFESDPYSNTSEIGAGILQAFFRCKTEHEVDIVNSFLFGYCGKTIEELIEYVKEKDAAGYAWESVF